MVRKSGLADVEVQWRPFLLNPNASSQGQNKLEYYNSKFGEQRVQSMIPFMTERMKEVGISYSMGGLTGSTIDSHRLIAFAEKQGYAKQDEIVEELMKNYFSEEKFLGDREVLIQAADKAGLIGAAEFLADPNNGMAEVQEQLQLSQTLRVTGVPYFVVKVGNKTAATFSGAQPADAFLETFQKLAH